MATAIIWTKKELSYKQAAVVNSASAEVLRKNNEGAVSSTAAADSDLKLAFPPQTSARAHRTTPPAKKTSGAHGERLHLNRAAGTLSGGKN